MAFTARRALLMVGPLVVLCVGLSVLSWARASASARAMANVSVTIVAPLPVVSVLEVMPPVIAANGAVLIHVTASDWLSLPITSGEPSTPEAASMATTAEASAQGTLRDGLTTSVSGTANTGPGRDAATGPLRVLVEFN